MYIFKRKKDRGVRNTPEDRGGVKYAECPKKDVFFVFFFVPEVKRGCKVSNFTPSQLTNLNRIQIRTAKGVGVGVRK